jgi:hypothetical protein
MDRAVTGSGQKIKRVTLPAPLASQEAMGQTMRRPWGSGRRRSTAAETVLGIALVLGLGPPCLRADLTPGAREAFERGVAGHTRGKLVLAVDKP